MLMGSNEVPANNSTAIPQYLNLTILQSIYNTVTHNVASITSGHIHKGAAGTNGSVVFHLLLLHRQLVIRVLL
jgi:hypothetical protein